MQRTADAVAVLAILVGTAGSFALSSRLLLRGSSPPIVGVLAPNAPAQEDAVLRFPLPPADGRVLLTQPEGELRVFHVPTVRRGDAVVRHERQKRKKRQKRRRLDGR